MCGTDHSHHHDNGRFGFLVDTPEIRALIGETEQLMGSDADPATRVEALKPAFSVDFTKEKLGRPHHMKFSAKPKQQVALARADVPGR